MEPTLVAPTGTIPKKPYLHLPNKATLSLSTNKSFNLFAIQGLTEKSSPKSLLVSEEGGEGRRKRGRTNRRNVDDVLRPKR